MFTLHFDTAFGAVLFASGDVLAQYVEQWKKEGFTLDTGRSIRSLVFGLCFSGIMNHYHLGFLDYLFTRGAFSSVPKALAPFGKRTSSVPRLMLRTRLK